MGLSLLVFTQLFSKFARSEARQTGAKTEVNAKEPFNNKGSGLLTSRMEVTYRPTALLYIKI